MKSAEKELMDKLDPDKSDVLTHEDEVKGMEEISKLF